MRGFSRGHSRGGFEPDMGSARLAEISVWIGLGRSQKPQNAGERLKLGSFFRREWRRHKALNRTRGESDMKAVN
jgi:hypothetical protein